MAVVMIGVDPHKGSHTAVALGTDEVVLGQVRVRASAAQAERLLAWAQAWPERTWAVEGVGGLGHLLAQQLLAAAPRFAGTPITLSSARKLLKNEDAMIYDNPHALVLCHYKRDKALCHRDGARDTPSLDHCVPGCGNIARADQQAAQLRERALALESQAVHVPQPVGDRLRASAARLRALADKHDRTRITAGEGQA